jgi:23S rRNA (cytosine1962-C5)-methyltransferase
VYRSDVRSAQAEAGAIVRVMDERGRFNGRAFYSDKSQIAVRLLTQANVPVDRAFFAERLRRAAAYRETVVENTDAYRLVHGEADLLPSIVIDRYGDYLVVQTLSQASERQKDLIVEIMVEQFSPQGILERNDPKVRCRWRFWRRKMGLRSCMTWQRDKRPGRSWINARITGRRGGMRRARCWIASVTKAGLR